MNLEITEWMGQFRIMDGDRIMATCSSYEMALELLGEYSQTSNGDWYDDGQDHSGTMSPNN